MKIHIKTTGCRANQWDSYVISNLFLDKGHVLTKMEDADICIINACTLTENAERDIKRFVNQCRTKNPQCKVIITGCHAEVYPERDFGANLLVGNREKFNISKYISDKAYEMGSINNTLEKAYIRDFQSEKTRFFLKIQDGCNRFCSYCIVPFARGNPRSRDLEEILQVMESLRDIGVKEVVLTGIELSAYKDKKTKIDLVELLKILEQAKTPDRIRLSSIDPLYINDCFISTIQNSKKIAKSLHISAQSFSNKILKLMKRNYTKEYLISTVNKLLTCIPDIGIGMDIIVGFPAEDDRSFEETLETIKSLDIYYLHVFSFSPREKTEAASMLEQIPYNIKKQRVNILRALDRKKRLAFYERFLGRKATIIPENKLYRQSYLKGYTDNFIPVFIPYDKNLENTLTDVNITHLKDSFVYGKIAN